MTRRIAHSGTVDRVLGNESGAILPLTALVLVILFVFAAFAVDLGAAWSERRNDQTAADAAAMAGAIEYIRSNPTEAEVLAVVKDYVSRNLDLPTDSSSWDTCPAPTDGFQPLSGNNCVSLKQASTTSSDTLLKVRIPDQLVETAFARVIGIDTIAVSASAVARIEQNPGLQGALPFVLPLDPGIEYCLGTPPSGQARELCQGPSNGFFGSIDSEFFGAAADPWGTTSCNDSPTNNNTRVVWNTALGVDHFLRIAPTGALAASGADVCAATQNPSYVPYAIVADQGSLTQASDGYIGAGPYGSTGEMGRLRQSGGTPVSWRDVPDGSGTMALDNVGLWEYLVDPADTGNACHSNQFAGLAGTQLTAQLFVCLNTGDVKLDDRILASPRFAIVPQIDANQANIGTLGPTSKRAINIVKFVPVYLQSSWFNCSATGCMEFASDPAETPQPAAIPQVFDPGEGLGEGCEPAPSGCKSNVNIVLEGTSAIVFANDDWLPDAFDNQFNDSLPFNVYLFR